MKFGKGLAASVSILLICMLTACGGSDTSGRVQIEFFQNKPEAKGSFDALIQKFNESQSDITVVHVNPPDAETVLKTRVVKDDIPDIVGMGATDTYSLLAQSGIFMDMTGSPLLSRIDETYVQMLKDVSGMEEVIGIPYSTNANGVMYNKEIFSKLGLSVPRTWDELLATAKKAKDGERSRSTSHTRTIGRRCFRSTPWPPIWKASSFIWIAGKGRSRSRTGTVRLRRSSWS